MWIQGRYRLDEVIGQGGMATVYRAWQSGLERWVAVKQCRWQNPEELELFRHEARLLGGLRHPALVGVHDWLEEDDVAYLVMELIEGETLRHRVEQTRPEESQCLRWTDEILEVLEFLHSQSPPVILKDLKPENLMLELSGRLRFLDFGIAKRLLPGGGTQLLLKGVGSEFYAPLEQYGQGSTDQRSDFYSLGATLYFMLTGQDPMPAWQRLARHEVLNPRGLAPEISESSAYLVERLTGLFPQDRPQDVGAVRLLRLAPEPPRKSRKKGEVTRVDAPPPGKARLLQAELRKNWDLGSATRDLQRPVMAWNGDRPEIWVAGAVAKDPARPQSEKGTLLRLDLHTGKSLEEHSLSAGAAALAVAADGRRWALATQDRHLFCWDSHSHKSSSQEGGPWKWLSLGNQHLLALNQQNQLGAYTFPEGQRLRSFGPQQWWLRFTGHRLGPCQADSHRLAAAASDGALFVWEQSSGKALWQSHLPAPSIALDFSRDEQFLVTSSSSGVLSLWQAESGQLLLQSQLDQPWQNLHCFGRALLGIEAGAVVVWDFSNAAPRLRIQVQGKIEHTALSPQGWLACLLADGRLLVFDFELT